MLFNITIYTYLYLYLSDIPKNHIALGLLSYYRHLSNIFYFVYYVYLHDNLQLAQRRTVKNVTTFQNRKFKFNHLHKLSLNMKSNIISHGIKNFWIGIYCWSHLCLVLRVSRNQDFYCVFGYADICNEVELNRDPINAAAFISSIFPRHITVHSSGSTGILENIYKGLISTKIMLLSF